MSKYKVLQVGYGPLGIKVYQMIQTRDTEEVVAVVDLNPELTGLDAGELADSTSSGIAIASDLESAVRASNPDVAVVTTVSDMERITPLVEQLVSLNVPVVSTCEELLHPTKRHQILAQRIDSSAKSQGVAVLGTGVNPGFLMDSLPSFLTAVCSEVEKVEVNRYQDAQYRRIPFQQKIGAGLSPEQYEAKKATGTLRHVGLTESLQFIAQQLGWKLDRTEDVLSAVITDQEIRTADLTIPAGYASGVRQIGSGYVDGVEKIRLVFQAAVGEPESYDEVIVHGNPKISSRIEGGVNGDVATCAITLNAIPSVLAANPGLRTMADVPMISCKGKM